MSIATNDMTAGTLSKRGLAPARQNDLSQEVANRLREAILQGRFMPGERLREAELAATLEVSRGPVREALAQLEHEGLVITQRNRGASVARLSPEDAEEVKSLRLALERLAVELTVRHADDGALKALEDMVDALRTANPRHISVREIAEFEIGFHDLLYRAARHRRLYKSWSSLRSQVHVLMMARNVDEPRFRDVLVERHLAIVSALRSREVGAAVRVIQEHVFGYKSTPSAVEALGA